MLSYCGDILSHKNLNMQLNTPPEEMKLSALIAGLHSYFMSHTSSSPNCTLDANCFESVESQHCVKNNSAALSDKLQESYLFHLLCHNMFRHRIFILSLHDLKWLNLVSLQKQACASPLVRVLLKDIGAVCNCAGWHWRTGLQYWSFWRVRRSILKWSRRMLHYLNGLIVNHQQFHDEVIVIWI